MQELGAWSDGIQVDFRSSGHVVTSQHFVGTDEGDADSLLLDTVIAGNVNTLSDLLAKMASSSESSEDESPLMERITRTFLASIYDAPIETLHVLLDTNLVDLHSYDDINERNCLHQAAIYGKPHVLEWGLAGNVAVERTDVYGRVPLHYASLHGRLDMLEALLDGKITRYGSLGLKSVLTRPQPTPARLTSLTTTTSLLSSMPSSTVISTALKDSSPNQLGSTQFQILITSR